MINKNDPSITANYQRLRARIKAQGVENWLNAKADPPGLDSLIYLCKFSYFTGIITKGEIGRMLGLERSERKALVKAWYDDHREKGCGAC